MTDQTGGPSTPPGGTASPGGAPRPTFEQRVESFGREAGEAGERLGRRAEAWGKDLERDPRARRAADLAARVWGAFLIALGVWFLLDVTLGYDMPQIAWRDLWPIALILLGLVIVVRGMARTRA